MVLLVRVVVAELPVVVVPGLGEELEAERSV